MKPLRIGWFYQDLNPGGGQRVCREISRILSERGHRVTVVVPTGRSQGTVIDGVKIIEAGPRIASPSLSIVSALPFMPAVIGRQDVIISSMPLMSFLNLLRYDARLHYHWIHSDDYRLFDDGVLMRSPAALKLYKISAQLSCRLPLKYWCNSKWTMKRFQEHTNKPAEIVSPGVDTEIFKPVEGVKKDLRLIGIVGRRAKMKGMADLITALNILAVKDVEFRLDVFTREKLTLPQTRFPAEVVNPVSDSELALRLCRCGLFMSASWHEGFYLPALEAMACGTPVVATDSGGIREYAADGENCLLTPPRNPAKLAEAVARLLNDKELTARLAGNALRAAQEFTWERTADKIEAIISADLERK